MSLPTTALFLLDPRELCILPPTCQLLQIATGEPYAHSKGNVALVEHVVSFPGAQPGSNGILDGGCSISMLAKPQQSNSTAPRNVQNNISNQADPATQRPDRSLRMQYDTPESLDVRQRYPQDRLQPWTRRSSAYVHDSERSKSDAGYVEQSVESGWDGLVGQTKSGISQTHPQSHWKLDDDSMSYTVDKISHSVPKISEAESLHSPGPPGLDEKIGCFAISTGSKILKEMTWSSSTGARDNHLRIKA